MVRQFYNKKVGAWVKQLDNGKITNVKQKNPKKPFKGVKKMRGPMNKGSGMKKNKYSRCK